MNPAIHFISLYKLPKRYSWAMLYVVILPFEKGYFISIN